LGLAEWLKPINVQHQTVTTGLFEEVFFMPIRIWPLNRSTIRAEPNMFLCGYVSHLWGFADRLTPVSWHTEVGVNRRTGGARHPAELSPYLTVVQVV
jgi:hypothetical protein